MGVLYYEKKGAGLIKMHFKLIFIRMTRNTWPRMLFRSAP